MEATVGTAADIGHAFVGAIERLDFDAVESLLAPEVRFRALTPRREPVASTAAAARTIIEGWFSDSDHVEEVDREVGEVVGRLRVGYRLRLREAGVWKLVEQQGVATISDGRITDIALVCSGFLAIPEEGIEPAARLDALGEDCATLTPRIREAIGALQSGDVLEVTADDPAAEEGLRAWSRLTGHALVGVRSEPDGTAPSFYLRCR